MKEYTLDDFKPDVELEKAQGQWQTDMFGTTCWDINTSGILSFLMKRAGEVCCHYLSDLFISWNILMKEMEDAGAGYKGGRYLFGFREMGVDGNSYVLSRMNNDNMSGIEELYVLDVTVQNDSDGAPDMQMVLSNVKGYPSYGVINTGCRAEFEFLKDFAKQQCFDVEILRDQLRCLWTAYCIHKDISTDTDAYDKSLAELWKVMQEEEPQTADWSDKDSFDTFLCRYLV